MEFHLGDRVSVADGLYTGVVIDTHGAELLIELDGVFDELPTDLCRWFEGKVLWPDHADEVDLLERPHGNTEQGG